MEPPVDDSELIPGLLDDLGVRAGRSRGALQVPSGGGIIAKQHFRTAKVVIRMKKTRLFLQGGFDEFLPLRAIALFDG